MELWLGICVLEGNTKEVVMELDMDWDGNPNIVLAIKTRVGVALPIQVFILLSSSSCRGNIILNSEIVFSVSGQECRIYRRFQVDIQTISRWISLFRRCLLLIERKGEIFLSVLVLKIALDYEHEWLVFFMIQRNLDFTLKVIGGDISAIPGLSDAIEVQIHYSNVRKSATDSQVYV